MLNFQHLPMASMLNRMTYLQYQTLVLVTCLFLVVVLVLFNDISDLVKNISRPACINLYRNILLTWDLFCRIDVGCFMVVAMNYKYFAQVLHASYSGLAHHNSRPIGFSCDSALLSAVGLGSYQRTFIHVFVSCMCVCIMYDLCFSTEKKYDLCCMAYSMWYRVRC